MSQSILDIISKNPEIQHITNYMHPATVEEHRSNNCKINRKHDERLYIRLIHYFIGRTPKSIYKSGKIFSLSQFYKKEKTIQNNKENGNKRKCIYRILISQRYHNNLITKNICIVNKNSLKYKPECVLSLRVNLTY